MENAKFIDCHKQIKPTIIIVLPIINSQPETGSNKTSKTPKPKPIRQVASNFLSILHIYYLLYISIWILKK